MGSSNKHWPSMFKKSNYHNSQHGINTSLLSTGCHGDERTPEPKPRWNPKPDQIRILEAIFNSGMMNPPREEIKKIREQLQEYGPIGEANVFYWFQNRKSRSKNKHKQRHPNNRNLAKRKIQNSSVPNNNSLISTQTITTPLSSSSHHQNEIVVPNNIETDFQLPTPTFFSFPNEFSNMTQQLPQQNVDVPDLLNHEIFMKCENKIPMNEHYDQGIIQDHEAAMNINLGVTSNSLNDDSTLPSHPPIVNAHFTDPFSITQFQGIGEAEDFTEKCIVSINNHIFKVNVGPFNICQIFGDEAVLVDSSGQTILTDECGITLESLQHGASYYVV